jgi:hypothetical protein
MHWARIRNTLGFSLDLPRRLAAYASQFATRCVIKSECSHCGITPHVPPQSQGPQRSILGSLPRYSALAIEVMLTLGSAFQMHLRQTQGLAGSVIDLMGLTVAIPDYTTLSRRGQKRPAISQDRCPRARFTCWSTVPA